MSKIIQAIDNLSDRLHTKIDSKVSCVHTQEKLHTILSWANQKTTSGVQYLHDTTKKVAPIIKKQTKTIGNQIIQDIKKNPQMALASLLMSANLIVGDPSPSLQTKVNAKEYTTHDTHTIVPEDIAKIDQSSPLSIESLKANNPMTGKKKEFWDQFIISNPQYHKETIAPGVTIKRDVGGAFYIVQTGDTKSGIKQKLSQIPEFAYLSNPSYDTKITGFNIPSNNLQAGRMIPIPIPKQFRSISDKEFIHYATLGVQKMCNRRIYKDQMKSLLQHYTPEQIVESAFAFARSEAATDHKKFKDQIGQFAEYHRRENRYNAYSFSPYHILMGQGPGLKARTKIGMTEFQSYHPYFATQLFLGYMIEKHKDDAWKYLDITNHTAMIAKSYNGSNYKSNGYDEKLVSNLNYAQDNIEF